MFSKQFEPIPFWEKLINLEVMFYKVISHKVSVTQLTGAPFLSFLNNILHCKTLHIVVKMLYGFSVPFKVQTQLSIFI